MKNLLLVFLLALTFAACTNENQTSKTNAAGADMILINGKIAQGTSENAFVDAVAIKDGIFQKVGKNDEVMQ